MACAVRSDKKGRQPILVHNAHRGPTKKENCIFCMIEPCILLLPRPCFFLNLRKQSRYYPLLLYKGKRFEFHFSQCIKKISKNTRMQQARELRKRLKMDNGNQGSKEVRRKSQNRQMNVCPQMRRERLQKYSVETNDKSRKKE